MSEEDMQNHLRWSHFRILSSHKTNTWTRRFEYDILVWYTRLRRYGRSRYCNICSKDWWMLFKCVQMFGLMNAWKLICVSLSLVLAHNLLAQAAYPPALDADGATKDAFYWTPEAQLPKFQEATSLSWGTGRQDPPPFKTPLVTF